jgi:hypothetical protein
MRSATSPGGTPRARSSSRCECSPTDAVTDQRHPAPSPPSRRWPDRGEIFPSGTEAAADRDITTAAASPGPGQHPLCRLVTRQARSDGTTWRSDEDRQAPQPATGGDLECTSHGSPARKSPRVTPIDGITLSDRQFGENTRSAAVLVESQVGTFAIPAVPNGLFCAPSVASRQRAYWCHQVPRRWQFRVRW